HGLTLGDKELRALKLSRPQGIFAIDAMLQHAPGFADLTKDKRLNFAMMAADILLEKSIQAKLSREVPTALDDAEQATPHLDMIFRSIRGEHVRQGSPPSMLDTLQFGVSVTVHFSASWIGS